MAKSTWRFEYVDNNKSIEVNEAESSWIGYAVIRAPKGQTTAQFIPANNPQRIESMFGYASADWPDLYEVLDFNNKYGLYISAPTVDVVEYPNYYGGVYLTKQGVQEFYRVTNKRKPNYEVGIVPGFESTVFSGTSNSKITVSQLNVPGEQAVIVIDEIPVSVFKKTKYLDIDWPTHKGTFRYKLDKSSGYIYPDSSCLSDTSKVNTICGSFVIQGSTCKIVLGGNDSTKVGSGRSNPDAWNQPNDTEIPFLDFSKIKASDAYNYQYLVNREANGVWEDWIASSSDPAEILDAILKGSTCLVGIENTKLDYEIALAKRLHLVYDIKDDVYAHISQVSPTAQTSRIYIDNIVYDKWVYDKKLYYTTGSLPTPNSDNFNKLIDDDYCIMQLDMVKGVKKIYQYVYDDEDDALSTWKDVTEDWETKSVLAFKAVDGVEDEKAHHKIFYIIDGGMTVKTEDATDEDFQLKANVLYNTFHSKTTEEDNGGEIHVSGDFTGSLDEMGVDENGGDNYWEELLVPDESIAFAEVYVDKTFDDDLDENGIYTGTRIESVEIKIHGQRYVDYVVEQNIKEGRTGGNCTDASASIQKKFASIVKEGLIEASKPKYADVSIFFECTGLDSVKTYFTGIRTSHYTSTIISPKNISESLFNNVGKLTVTNRRRGTAQYVQELQYKDKNLRKKYYACPIGAMATMLLTIMEDYLGGVAPAWLNEGEVGGQLEGMMLRTPIKARWDFTDEDTKILDQKGLNPILMDVDDGVMAVSQRTTEQNAGDWSYLGHSMSFDLCKREIRDNIMKPQLMKKISPYWISKRAEQLKKILDKRTIASDPIWSYAKGDVAGVNNDYTRAQKIFNLSVEVRVYPFSEKVRLTFLNLGQITSISD